VPASAEFGKAVGSQGTSEQNNLPAGAAFPRAVGDPDVRARDLHKVQGAADRIREAVEDRPRPRPDKIMLRTL